MTVSFDVAVMPWPLRAQEVGPAVQSYTNRSRSEAAPGSWNSCATRRVVPAGTSMKRTFCGPPAANVTGVSSYALVNEVPVMLPVNVAPLFVAVKVFGPSVDGIATPVSVHEVGSIVTLKVSNVSEYVAGDAVDVRDVSSVTSQTPAAGTVA